MQAERKHGELGAGGRTPADVSTLMVELGRAFKGWSFYPPEHPARAELLDRTCRAWQGDLRRNGPLALEVRRGAFWLPGGDAPISSRSDDTARQLQLRAVRRVVFDGALDVPTLTGFLDLLVDDADALQANGGFEEAFYAAAPRQGIQINDADWRAILEEQRAEALEQEAASALPEFLAGDEVEEDADLDPLLPVEFGATRAPAADAEEPEHTQPVRPLDTAAARAHELEAMLSQLEECEDDQGYRELARHVASLAQRMVEAGELDGAFRALVQLANHAGDDAKRSFAQRESAGGFLGQLARGSVLEHLIDRALDGAAESSLEATAALRELGARAAPVVLDRLERESDPERRGRLAGVIIAMGEEAVPALFEALLQGSKRRMRVAVRLAGETQNPRLVACLREVLLSGESEVAREAARALVRVGDVGSLEVLAEALHSLRPEVTALAAYSLGSTGRVLAIAPLQEALGRALDQNELAFAREIVRGLGRLGRAEAAPVLAAVLERGGFFGRRKLRDVQLAAISALGQLPGPEAETALARAARSRDSKLRQAAQASAASAQRAGGERSRSGRVRAGA
ncbi:MAG: HEAT repeat domain-containing protein [Deltaproteobacteria bacterium]|nr:HEAT repeat domain-containing protein [Deltaproteobacteria bacterium]